MEYEQALSAIHGLHRFSKRASLKRMKRLLESAGNPQRECRYIHIAGTNGKGSTTALCAGILKEVGYRTGMYISPFVIDFRERFQVNGVMMEKQELTELVEELLPLLKPFEEEGDPITEFEFVTAVGFLYFARRKCDIVCLEVGLGGRFDATNIIDAPLVSVITSVSKDHTQILGDTIAQIAFEKCGIIKPGGITVSYPEQDIEALSVIMQAAAEKRNSLIVPGMRSVKVLKEGIGGTDIEYKNYQLHIPLPGAHQIGNTITALEAVFALRRRGFAVSDRAVTDGVAGVRFPARLEVLSDNPFIILDGAHNLSGGESLSAVIEKIRSSEHSAQITCIVGILQDKDYAGMAQLIAPLCSRVICVEPDNPRAMPAEKLAEHLKQYCPDTRAVQDKKQALSEALRLSGAGDYIFICGSLYLASEMRKIALQFLESRSSDK